MQQCLFSVISIATKKYNTHNYTIIYIKIIWLYVLQIVILSCISLDLGPSVDYKDYKHTW